MHRKDVPVNILLRSDGFLLLKAQR